MDSLPQEADARHPRNRISIDPYLAVINLFDILPGHDFFRGAHFIDLPILEKNEAITIFRSEVQIMGRHEEGEAFSRLRERTRSKNSTW